MQVSFFIALEAKGKVNNVLKVEVCDGGVYSIDQYVRSFKTVR